MGLTPGFLSRAMSLQARRGWREAGSTSEEQSLRATRAREWQRLSEADWKAVQNLFQEWASTPEGPAAPKVLIAAALMRLASICSKMTG